MKRSRGCSIPGGVQGQVGWGWEQSQQGSHPRQPRARRAVGTAPGPCVIVTLPLPGNASHFPLRSHLSPSHLSQPFCPLFFLLFFRGGVVKAEQLCSSRIQPGPFPALSHPWDCAVHPQHCPLCSRLQPHSCPCPDHRAWQPGKKTPWSQGSSFPGCLEISLCAHTRSSSSRENRVYSPDNTNQIEPSREAQRVQGAR